VKALRRAVPLSLGVEVALAFAAGAASFTLVAVTVVAAGSDAVVVALDVAYIAAVAAMFRFWGIAYAVPAAVAALFAYDWYYLPPTHPHEFPDRANLVDLLAYLGVGVLIGQLAANAGRRAELSDHARGALAEEVGRLADEQAALRRVATLVARESPASEVFAKVAEEVGLLLGADGTRMHCYEPDGSATVVANWGVVADVSPLGARLDFEGDSVAARVRRTERPVRIDDYAALEGGPMAGVLQARGVRSAVGCPITVDGRPWGAMVAAMLRAEPLPADAESRVQEFTELVATAISNIQARTDLAASRARIVAAADEERRRVVRDLHDGAQQRLVHTVVTLKLARRALESGAPDAPALVNEALEHAQEATGELRELAHGIHPSVLTLGGLRAGVDALASRMPVPVDIAVSVDRLLPAVEATAYFFVAETLTNVAKHAHADRAAVTARVENGTLHVQVRDDGVGGARPNGSGLVGLGDRLSVLDGTLRVESPAEGGTLVTAAIPLVP
jgi:signal transduction histidine kinase